MGSEAAHSKGSEYGKSNRQKEDSRAAQTLGESHSPEKRRGLGALSGVLADVDASRGSLGR